MTPLEEIARFADVPIDIEVQLGRRTMRVRELLALQGGQLIALARAADDSVDVFAGGAPFAAGEIVLIGGALAARIIALGAD